MRWGSSCQRTDHPLQRSVTPPGRASSKEVCDDATIESDDFRLAALVISTNEGAFFFTAPSFFFHEAKALREISSYSQNSAIGKPLLPNRSMISFHSGAVRRIRPSDKTRILIPLPKREEM